MLITYYEDGTRASKGPSRLLVLLMAANVAFASTIMFAWTYISLIVAEPLSWATWMPISKGYGILGVFDYPFLIFWVLPLIGVCGAWVSDKGGRKTAAFAFVGVPIAMLLLIFGWYYLAPVEWH